MHVQRWRLIYRRGPDAPDLSQRDQLAAWQRCIVSAGLAPADGPDAAKVVLAAAMPSGMTGDRELADILLPVRVTAADAREGLRGALPTGHELVDLFDVWTGEPALPGQVVAADYLVDIDAQPAGTAPIDLASAIEALLAAETLPRGRARSGGSASANLRPLIHDVQEHPGGLWMRLRMDPSLGSGRPDEVLAAIIAMTGRDITATRIRRERLWLRDEWEADAARPTLGRPT